MLLDRGVLALRVRHVTVLRDLGLGDFLTAVPALRALRRHFPDAVISLVGPGRLVSLARLSGVVDRVVAAPRHAPDLAVNLHGRGPQSHWRALAWRPRRLLAFAHPSIPASRSGPEWDAGEHEVHRWCRLVGSAGIETDPGDLGLAVPALEREDDLTVVHPGAASAARRWPAERFSEVVRSERARGRRVLITGGEDEAALADEVARGAGLGRSSVVAGRLDVADLARLVAGAGRLVCGDTGVAHLATAVGTPSVVLFGPTPPSRWGPPPDRPWHRVLWAGTTGDPHAAAPDAGLLAIGVADVVSALATVDLAAAPRWSVACGPGGLDGG